MAKTRIFTDLDFNFAVHPYSTDVTRKYDEEAIKQSVKALVMTDNYERPFHPEIGSQVSHLLFENFSPLTVSMIETSITNTITNFEPRVQLIRVNVLPNDSNNALYVTIIFKIVNTEKPLTIDFTLQRTR
jgi:phage baseplate assembly protein W